jgi:hypothetical protein
MIVINMGNKLTENSFIRKRLSALPKFFMNKNESPFKTAKLERNLNAAIKNGI